MSITLEGQPHERICVTGDIITTLRVPVGWADRRFRIATSDGTLNVTMPSSRYFGWRRQRTSCRIGSGRCCGTSIALALGLPAELSVKNPL